MSVKPKRVFTKSAYRRPALCAGDILCFNHPLHDAFVKWLAGKPITKRQARKFLALHPYYGEVRNG